nr:glycosyltransferase [Kineococcus siccus]
MAPASEAAPAPGRPVLVGRPELTVMVSTYDRPDALDACLSALERQTLPRTAFRVLVVDDASPRPVADVVARHGDRLDVRLLRLTENVGPGGARTRGVAQVETRLTLLLDDDDLPEPRCLEEHFLAHQENPGEDVAVLGGTSVLPGGTMTPLSRHVMTVGRQYFAYPGVEANRLNPWRAFWCGRSSAKTALLQRHGFTTRFMEDADFAFRAGKGGLRVHYAKRAVQVVRERLTLEHFHRRQNRIGHAMIDLARRCQDDEVWTWAGIEPVSDHLARWIERRTDVERIVGELADLPVEVLRARSHEGGDLLGLFDAALFIDLDAHYAAGLLAALRRRQAHVQERRTVFGARHDDPAATQCLAALAGQAWAGAVVLAPSPRAAQAFADHAGRVLGDGLDQVEVEVRVSSEPLHAHDDVDLVLSGSLPPRWRTGMAVPLIGQPVHAWIDQLRDAVSDGPRGALR